MTRLFRRHLSNLDLAAALDERRRGGVNPRRAAHLARCPRCRAELDALERLWRRLEADRVPEPSPLFWEAFSARVNDAIAREPAPAGGRARWLADLSWPARLAATAALVALVVAAAAIVERTRDDRVGTPVASGPAIAPAPRDEAPGPEAPADDGLLLVAEAAQLDWDLAVAAGLAPRRDAAEWALLQLSDDERRELARLLHEELSNTRYP
jgi:hypothetical protein